MESELKTTQTSMHTFYVSQVSNSPVFQSEIKLALFTGYSGNPSSGCPEQQKHLKNGHLCSFIEWHFGHIIRNWNHRLFSPKFEWYLNTGPDFRFQLVRKPSKLIIKHCSKLLKFFILLVGFQIWVLQSGSQVCCHYTIPYLVHNFN